MIRHTKHGALILIIVLCNSSVLYNMRSLDLNDLRKAGFIKNYIKFNIACPIEKISLGTKKNGDPLIAFRSGNIIGRYDIKEDKLKVIKRKEEYESYTPYITYDNKTVMYINKNTLFLKRENGKIISISFPHRITSFAYSRKNCLLAVLQEKSVLVLKLKCEDE